MGGDRKNLPRKFFNSNIALNKSVRKTGYCQKFLLAINGSKLQHHMQQHYNDKYEQILAENAVPMKHLLPHSQNESRQRPGK